MKTIPLGMSGFSLLGATVCALHFNLPASAAAPKEIGAVNVAGVSVKGLTATEAQRRLTRELRPRLNRRVKLTDGKRAIYRRRADVGIGLNIRGMVSAAQSGRKYVPLQLTADTRDVQSALRRLAPRFNFSGRDARLVELRGGRVRIVKEQAGRKLDVGRSAVRVARTVNGKADARVLELVSNTTPRKLTAARFKGIDARIGSYSTNFNPAKVKRTQNMRIAIRAIDGTFVQPGKVFSLNETVGERTQKRGYRTSIIFKNGYKVPGIGAGVSQVTGTLFNAALTAGLPINEVRFHSQPVPYLPIGRDATVAWGGFDMKFKNNTQTPLYITYKLRGSSVRAAIFGKKQPGRKVSITVRKQQKGPRHIASQTYRVIRQNGKVLWKEKIRSHTYKWKVGEWEE